MSKPFQYSLQTEITFKKYAGQGLTLKEVIAEDLNYIKWLHNNEKIKMDREAFEYMCSKAGIKQKWAYGRKSKILR